jgi:flagellar basal-body rod modification protein FlgD
MAAAAIFNHAMTAGQALTGPSASPMDSTTTGTSGSSGDSATISANDFLTLLVTEMQNQDPTANTDPNEYINQLVSVNSLEQLIDINQTLSGDVSGTGSDNGPSGQVAAHGAGGASEAGAAPAAQSATHGALSANREEAIPGGAGAAQSPAAQHTPGNLSVPHVNPAGQRVAHALDGRMHGRLGEGSGIAMQ